MLCILHIHYIFYEVTEMNLQQILSMKFFIDFTENKAWFTYKYFQGWHSLAGVKMSAVMKSLLTRCKKDSTTAILIEGKSPLLSTVGHYQSRLTENNISI